MKFKSKKILPALLLSAIAYSSLYAVDTDDYMNARNIQQERDQNGNIIPPVTTIYPYETNDRAHIGTTPQIQKDRFELSINENFVKSVSQNKDRYSKIITETIDINLLVDNIVKQVRNTDIIYLHPHFLTTIAFPVDTEIIYANSSATLEKFEFSQNLLVIQPPKDFVNSNIVVTFRDAERTYYMNLILQKYTQKVTKDKKYNRYVIDDNYLSLNYSYVRNLEYSPLEVLQTYFRLNGDNIVKSFKEDGYYDIILLGGVTFYVIRDASFGTIDYSGLRFKVAQQYEFADKSIMGVKIGDKNKFYPTTESKRNKSKR